MPCRLPGLWHLCLVVSARQHPAPESGRSKQGHWEIGTASVCGLFVLENLNQQWKTTNEIMRNDVPVLKNENVPLPCLVPAGWMGI